MSHYFENEDLWKMDLFEELYNRDLNLYNENYKHNNATEAYCTNSLFRAEQAMQTFVSPDNVDIVERMVNTYNDKENDRLDSIKGKIDAYHAKAVEGSLSSEEKDAYFNLQYKYVITKRNSVNYGEGFLKNRIADMKKKTVMIEEHKKESRDKKKDISVDKLADKMKFIEKRVSFVREYAGINSRKQEDKIRFSAYKDFKTKSNE